MTVNYKKLTQLEHIKLRPGMYIGNTKNHEVNDFLIDFNTNKFELRQFTYNPGLLKLFDEVISNCVDASKEHKKSSTKIYVNIDKVAGQISIEDNIGIPVVPDKVNKSKYVPEMIFSEFLYGSNFDDTTDSTAAGQNGLGVKLVNVFSKNFDVITADGKHQFIQSFSDGMNNSTLPQIQKSKKRFTKIVWTPDYEFFGTDLDESNYNVLVKRIYSVAACNVGIKFYLDGTLVPIKNFKQYAEAHSEDCMFDNNDEHWRVGFAPSDSGFRQVSFVNSTETKIGGTHVNYVTNQAIAKLREFIKKKHKVDVKPSEIKNHMMVFVDCDIVNPRYSSQTKEDLITEVSDFKTKYIISDRLVKELVKSDIVASIIEWIEAKKLKDEMAELRKLKAKRKRINVAAHIPCSSKNRDDCCLFITEGLSAQNTWINVRDGKVHGAFPLRGKCMNVNGMKPLDIMKNKEYADLTNILGLHIGQRAFNLNYGQIYIMTDADEDGYAISCLLINFLSIWPELFDEDRIKVVRSPIVIVTNKKTKRKTRFFDLAKFDSTKYDDKLFTIDYLKGLGSLSEDEYSRMINDPVLENIKLNKSDVLEMAFGKDADKRKDWLMNTK